MFHSIQDKLYFILTAMIATLPLAGIAQDTTPAKPITNSIGMRLTPIPAGKFTMGSPATEPEREQQESQHEVVITRPFYMGVCEVTQGQMIAVIGNDRKYSPFFDKDRGGGPDHPIENIEWQAAVEFCAKLSALPAEKSAGRTYRLPTEAEWEYACRAGTTTAYHCGDSLSSTQANFNGVEPFSGAAKGPYLKKTVKVGSYPPNAFGLYDMHGNVAEFCADWYSKDYYAKSPVEDPPGPPEGASSDDFGNTYLVVRGGCWLDDARACRSAYRYRAMSTNRYPQNGFRVVCEIDAAVGDQ
jgi:formylglycine-generating enzyme required for sulfatase activity